MSFPYFSLIRKYMQFIIENYNGGPVGIETIAAGISEERDSVEETIEPYLIKEGFLDKTPRGRVLTKKSFEHLGIEVIGDVIMQGDLF